VEVLALLQGAGVNLATKGEDAVLGRPEVWQRACGWLTDTVKADEGSLGGKTPDYLVIWCLNRKAKSMMGF